MSVTEAVPVSTTTSTPSATDRKGAAAAAALVGVALFVTVATVNVPYKAGDAELLAWWQVSGNRMAGLVSGLAAVCAAVLLPVVLNHLQGLRAAAAAPRWLAFARSMGAAVTAVWLVTGAARATVGHLVDVMDEPLPGLDVLRFATALNYTLLGVSGMAVIGLCTLGLGPGAPHGGTGPLGGIRRGGRRSRHHGRCAGAARCLRDAVRGHLGARARCRHLASAR